MTRVDLLGGRKKSIGAIKGDICGEKPWRHVLTLHLLLIVQDKKKKKKGGNRAALCAYFTQQTKFPACLELTAS